MLKPLSVILAVLVLIVLLVLVEFVGPSGKPTVFAEVDFDKAQAQAQAAGAGSGNAKSARVLVVVFTGEGCEACKEMDRRVWSSGAMTDWLNRHAVAVKIDRDKDPGHARSLGVQSIPAVVLIDGKKPLAKFEGTHTARDLIEKFDAALAARPAAGSPAKPAEPEKKEPAPDPKPAEPATPGGASETPASPMSPR